MVLLHLALFNTINALKHFSWPWHYSTEPKMCFLSLMLMVNNSQTPHLSIYPKNRPIRTLLSTTKNTVTVKWGLWHWREFLGHSPLDDCERDDDDDDARSITFVGLQQHHPQTEKLAYIWMQLCGMLFGLGGQARWNVEMFAYCGLSDVRCGHQIKITTYKCCANGLDGVAF